uniref:NADH dehydrogenase [ubiquinone] 1 beta subcomplex subunit 2, mitochondrial n=1 Tax=Globodera pallida TaxID=36090 RepID=A0A183BWA8_GLOPA
MILFSSVGVRSPPSIGRLLANLADSRRQFSLSGPRPGFIFDYFTKDPKDMAPFRDYIPRPTWAKHGIEMPLRQILPGHYDDPEFHTRDREYFGSPRFGDKIPEGLAAYRRNATDEDELFLPRAMHKFLSIVFWYWFFYTLYWHHGEMYTGEWYYPYHYEWTDEELGIPPDDAPDPEEGQFWGHPGALIGSYRG